MEDNTKQFNPVLGKRTKRIDYKARYIKARTIAIVEAIMLLISAISHFAGAR